MNLNEIDKTASLSSNNSLSLMVFKLSSEFSDDFNQAPFLGINIFKVKEVLNYQEYNIQKMPKLNEGDNSYLMGVINVRGDYIPVYSLSEWLGYPNFEYKNNRSVIIVAEINNMKMGIHVAYIHGVFEKSWGELKESSMPGDKVISETRVDDDLCLVVDIENMISDIKGQDLVKESESELEIVTDKTVVFADDSKSIREYMTSLLRNLKVKHFIFEDGSGLIDYIDSLENTDSIGLVLTDLEMPNVSGHTVIKHLKSKGFNKPIIVHSSMTVSDSKRQAKELGADGFIGKIDSEAIISVLKEHLEC